MDTKIIESNFQLLANRITKLSIDNDFLYIFQKQPLERSIDVKFDTGEVIEQDGLLTCTLKLHISVVIKEKDGKKITKKFKSNITVEGFFVDSGETLKEDFLKMVKLNGSASLYSIARGLFIGITSQTLIEGQVILPLVNFIKMQEIQNNSKE